MRATTVFKRLMDLPGVTVTDVDFQPAKVVVTDSVQVFRRLFVFDLSGRVSLRGSSVVCLDLARRPIVQLAV